MASQTALEEAASVSAREMNNEEGGNVKTKTKTIKKGTREEYKLRQAALAAVRREIRQKRTRRLIVNSDMTIDHVEGAFLTMQEKKKPDKKQCHVCKKRVVNLYGHQVMTRCRLGCNKEVMKCDYLNHLREDHPVVRECYNKKCKKGVRNVGGDHLIHERSRRRLHCGIKDCETYFRKYSGNTCV